MKRNYLKIIKSLGKVFLLIIITLSTSGSNSRQTSITIVNENSNLNKMLDVEQMNNAKPIRSNEEEQVVAITALKEEKTQEALEKLAFDMDLSKPSGFTLKQFQKALLNSKTIRNDRNNIFKDNIHVFYETEQKYGINGIFLLSIAVHESGWGTSKLAVGKNNLFGYIHRGVGMSFETPKAGIDYAGRTIIERYLLPKGSEIKGMDTLATGVYHNGNTISSVNVRYASDKAWADKIYKYMVHFYKNVEISSS